MERRQRLEWRKSAAARICYLAAAFFLAFGAANVSYLLPVFYARAGYGARESGWLVAAFYLASIAVRPFVGHTIITLGFTRLFLIAGVLSVCGCAGMALAGPHFWTAFAARSVFGMGSAFLLVGLGAYQAYAFNEHERGRAYSLIMAGGLAPMLTAVPLADWILHRGHTQAYILIPLLLSCLILPVTLTLPRVADGPTPEHLPTRRNPFQGLGACFAIPGLRVALFSALLFCCVDALAAFMASMTNRYGLMASYFLSSNALVGVSIRLFCGNLLDRWPRWKLSAPIILGMTALLLLASVNPSRWSLIALGLLFGVGMGFGFPLNLALVSDWAPRELLPQAMSLAWFMLGLGFALAPLVTGWMGEATDPVTAYRAIGGTIFIGGLYLAWLWFHRGKPD